LGAGRFERIDRISRQIEARVLCGTRSGSEGRKPCRSNHNREKRGDSKGVPTAAHSCPHRSGLRILQRRVEHVEEINEAASPQNCEGGGVCGGGSGFFLCRRTALYSG